MHVSFVNRNIQVDLEQYKVLEVLAGTFRQEEEIKGIYTRKEDVEMSVFYRKRQNLHRKTIKTHKFSKVTGHKINTENSAAFSSFFKTRFHSQRGVQHGA